MVEAVAKYSSSISWAKEGKSKSVKTTIPREIADLLELSPEYMLGWEYDTKTAIVTVRREPKQK